MFRQGCLFDSNDFLVCWPPTPHDVKCPRSPRKLYFWHLQLQHPSAHYKRMLFWSPTPHTDCKKPLWNFLSLVNYIHIGLNIDWQKTATWKFITPGHYKGMNVQMETSCQASRKDPTYETSIWKWMFKPILAMPTFWKHLLQQTLPYWGALKYMKSRVFVVAI